VSRIDDSVLAGNIAIVGKTGSGKSYTAKGFVERLLEQQRRICIVDPTGVWWGLRSKPDGSGGGFQVVVFGGVHADVPIAQASGPALAALIAGQNLPAIIDVSEMTMGGRVRFATGFFEALYAANKSALTLVLDEADLFAPQRAMPDQTVMLNRVEQIVRRGRVRGFRSWVITQRPAELHKSVLSQADTLIAMKLTAPQDRDAIGAWIEGQGDRDQGKKVLADLPKLQKGQGWLWSPAFEILRRQHFPVIATYDSSRSPEDGEELPPVTLADVDVSAIGESLATAAAEAEANDPRTLRRQLQELEVQLRAASRAAADPAAIAAAEERGFERALGQYRGSLGIADNYVSEAIRALENARMYLESMEGSAPPRPAVRAPAAASDGYAPPARTSLRFSAVPAPSAPGAALSKAERLVLTALAQYPAGRSKTQVAILTGYASNGGGFNNALSSCRSRGFLEGPADALIILPSGLAALGTFDPLPHGAALLRHWLGQLSKAEKKALEALVEVYPRSLSKVQLANRAGYEPDGGGFNNALSRLRTLELIGGRGELKASEDLFG
jgi:hypothetical protein